MLVFTEATIAALSIGTEAKVEGAFDATTQVIAATTVYIAPTWTPAWTQTGEKTTVSLNGIKIHM